MAIKKNIPLVAALGLVAAGLVALALFLGPSDPEMIREAAAKHGASLGSVRDVRVFGTVADIEFTARPVLYAQFARQGGSWAFAKDLGADFERFMKDPETSGGILKRLAQRIADRTRMSVTLKEGIRYDYRLGRRPEGIEGEVVVHFAYPKQGDRQVPGLYREMFRYAEGTWESQGVGSLYDPASSLQR